MKATTTSVLIICTALICTTLIAILCDEWWKLLAIVPSLTISGFSIKGGD